MDDRNRRHEPTKDCPGLATRVRVRSAQGPLYRVRCCPECGLDLCPCELAYGHDCE
jgi:hypothetical protein